MDNTPQAEVTKILSHLEEIYITVLENKHDNLPTIEIKNSFKAYCAETWSDESTSGEELAAEFNRRENEEGNQFFNDIGEEMPFLLICLSTEYCVQAIKAKDLNMAWGYITEANFWRWFLNHTIIREEAKKEALTEKARTNANKRLNSDPKHHAMNAIKLEFCNNPLKFEKRGYLQYFVNEQATIHQDTLSDPRSIRNYITRLKKAAGITIKSGIK